MSNSYLDLISDFPQKLKAPLTGLYKRKVLDDSMLEIIADAAALTTPDIQILPFALGALHMRQNAVPVADTLRMAREQGRKVNLHWSAKRWKIEHDRLSRFATLNRLSEAATIYDLNNFKELLPRTFNGYLIPTSRRLGAEGLRQCHCVASWHDRIRAGRTAIASIFVNQRRFTVELFLTEFPRKKVNIGQVRGRFNRLPTKNESNAIYGMLGIEQAIYTEVQNSSADNYHILNLGRVIPVLQRHSINKVVVKFDGSGDSGCIDEVIFYAADEEITNPPLEEVSIRYNSSRFENGHWMRMVEDKVIPLSNAIDDIVDDWLSSTSVDWYNNAGGFGDCIIDVENGELQLDVSVRVTESELAYFKEYAFDEIMAFTEQ